MKVSFVILGEPASKANSRQIVTIANRPSSIKSAKARSYQHSARLQIPSTARLRLEGPICVRLRIWYRTQRPDLDESVVLDVLQDHYSPAKRDRETGRVYIERALVQAGVYRNDRQVKEKHVYWGIDPRNPRAEIEVEALHAQQPDLMPDLAETDVPY